MRRFLLPACVAAGIAAAQTAPTCATDTRGNVACAKAQPNENVCGYTKGLGSSRPTPILCNDVEVRQTRPDGQLVCTRVLGGESDQTAFRLAFDGRDNVIVVGATWSSGFPTTADAIQKAYSGPPPARRSPPSTWNGGAWSRRPTCPSAR